MKRFIFITLFCYGISIQAQSVAFTQGMEAFGKKEFTAAETAFKSIAQTDSSYAESRYMLAKIYFESDLKDVKKSERFLREALELKPNNIEYLVARLSFLQSSSSNYISEILKDAQRRDICRKIIKLDSTNAFANEEFGNTYLREYLRYKESYSVPFNDGYSYKTERVARPHSGFNPNAAEEEVASNVEFNPNPYGLGTQNRDAVTSNQELAATLQYQPLQISKARLSNLFDIDAMVKLGIQVADLSQRSNVALKEAIPLYKTALLSDPLRRNVYLQLTRIYFKEKNWREVLTLLKSFYTYFPEDSEMWMLLGTAQFHLNDYENASRSFETGKHFMDVVRLEKTEDISLLLKGTQLESYNRDKDAYKQRFWAAQNPRFLTAVNERKLEHYARITYANLTTAVPRVEKEGWDTIQGQIIVRYGQPQRSYMLERKNKSFSRVLEERSITYVNDRNINNNLASDDGMDTENTMHVYEIWKYNGFNFVFYDQLRNGNFELYSPAADEMTLGVDTENDYVMIADEVFNTLPSTYTYTAPNRQVQLPYMVSTFKGTQTNADVFIHTGIPLNATDNISTETIPLNISLGAFLISENHEIIAENRQTLYGLKSSQVQRFEAQNLWLSTTLLKGESGKQQVSVEFETPGGTTVGYQRREVDIPNYKSDDFMLSDVMLAYNVAESFDGKPIKSGDVVRNGLSMTPAPWSVFSKVKSIYCYFEVYNLTQKADQTTSFDVEALLVPKETASGIARAANRLFGNRRKGVSVQFTGVGDTKDDGQYLDIDVSGEPEGVYTLTLRITDKISGKIVEQKKDLLLE